MFNPSPQRAAPQPWVPNAVIQPNQRQGVAGFETTDWDNVPRLDYQTEKFRQLAVPDPARVVDDASQFEPWQPKQLGEAVANKAPSVAPAAKSMPEGATESARHDTTTAFDEPGAEASADPERQFERLCRIQRCRLVDHEKIRFRRPRIAGYFQTLVIRDAAELQWLAVLEQHERQFIGHAQLPDRVVARR